MKFSFALIKKMAPGKYDKNALIETLNEHAFEAVDVGGDVIEISVPPNRFSDAASHRGIALEAAALLQAQAEADRKISASLLLPPHPKGKRWNFSERKTLSGHSRSFTSIPCVRQLRRGSLRPYKSMLEEASGALKYVFSGKTRTAVPVKAKAAEEPKLLSIKSSE